ncbi:MAG: hypothetical protein P8174_06135 [Gemmatimonadota bacterium]
MTRPPRVAAPSLSGRIARGILCTFLLVTSGCDVRGTIARATPPAADTVGRAAIRHAAAGTLADSDSILDPRMRTPRMRKVLEQIQTTLQPYSVGEPELIGYSWRRENGEEYRTLTYQARLKPSVEALAQNDVRAFHWMVTQVVLRGGDRANLVCGFHVNFSEASLAETNGFLRNLHLPQLIWLLLTLFAVGTIIFAVVQVVRAPMARRWLCVIVSRLGVARGTMNWSTGAFTIQPLSVQLFAVGFIRQGWYGPIILMWAFPAGAFWALEVVRRARRRAAFLAMLERGRAGET